MSHLTLQSDRVVTSDGTLWCILSHANLLDEPLPRSETPILAWSGWMGQDADPALGRFPRDFRTWTTGAWAALEASLADSPAEVILRPHARHVLSDPQSCLTFLHQRRARPVRLLLDPISMLTQPMLPRADEHVLRMLEALGGHPALAAVLVAGGERISDDDESLRPSPEGATPDHTLVGHIVEQYIPATTPRIVIARS